jgi:hypothetical protein
VGVLVTGLAVGLLPVGDNVGYAVCVVGDNEGLDVRYSLGQYLKNSPISSSVVFQLFTPQISGAVAGRHGYCAAPSHHVHFAGHLSIVVAAKHWLTVTIVGQGGPVGAIVPQ